MNTRLQVEHPVTEEITGLDLVEWQFRIAAGERLPLTQNQVRFEGHAIEARVYAEDPEHGFLPSTGKIIALEFPKNIRVDSGVEAGAEVTPFYDAMIAKLIARATSREAALERLDNALEATLIVGLHSNVAFLASLCRSDAFRRGAVDTGFIDRSLAALGALPRERDKAAAALGVTHLLEAAAARGALTHESEPPDADSPWSARDGFQLGGTRTVALPVIIDSEDAQAVVTYGEDGPRVVVDGVSAATDARAFAAREDVYVLRGGYQTRVRIKDFSEAATDLQTGDSVIKAPMHGRVMEIFAAAGDRVAFGQRLAVIEAMKMEHTLRAPFAAIVTEVPVSSGAQVVEGAPIVVLERVENSTE
jgi:3-methylcrotonyl-CoA carboxylase alpha subunit